jgi:C-terminal processing protease CtpA/Prc
MTRICKEYDNCTVVGTNTAGEGVCGSIFQCYLPESHFMFVYAPTISIEHPDDSYFGTMPDIYIPYTLDEYNARQDLFYSGTNPNSYEVRQQWDQTPLRVIDMTEED